MRAAVVAAVAVTLLLPVPAHPALALRAPGEGPGAPLDIELPELDVDPADFIDDAVALPEGLTTALARDVGITGAEYLAQAELAQRADEAVDALRGAGVRVEGSAIEEGRLVLEVPTTSELAAVEALGIEATTDSLSAPVEGVVFEPAATDLHAGAPYLYPGGGTQSGQTYRCSMGFAGFATATGAPQSITAGHCEGDPTASRRLVSMSRPGGSLSLGPLLGAPVAGSFVTGDGWDVGLVGITNPEVVPKPSVLTWGGGTSAPLATAPLLVRDAAALKTIGATLCKSGSSSGWTCGPVLGLQPDVVIGDVTSPDAYLLDAILACVDVVQGDSGGAAVSGTTAVGVTSAVGVDESGRYCGTPGRLIGLFAALYSPEAGFASAQSRYGSAWEPAVAVAVPTVTSFPASGAVYGGDVLAGQLNAGSTRHSVEVVIDGGIGRTATVSSSGVWSIDISDLPPGVHSYEITAHWGALSDSAAATGTWYRMSTQRIQGNNRYGTAAAIAEAAFPAGADTVFIAHGLSFPDALSAGPAAVALDAPLLLTDSARLPVETIAELERLSPSTIVVVGGPGVVSPAVESALGAYGSVLRWSGADRFETSRVIARNAFSSGAATAYVATGLGFPDALAAGAMGGVVGAPVILVNGLQPALDPATATLIESLGVMETRIAGGGGVVSAGIEADLGERVATVRRLAGADRYATSLAINADVIATASEAYLAAGAGFPDALAGSVLAGLRGAPMYLAPATCVPGGVIDHIGTIGASRVTLLGGTGVLGAGVARLTRC